MALCVCRMLVQGVFGSEIDPKVTDACFEQMDEDGSGEVDFLEFCEFFGVDPPDDDQPEPEPA